MIRFAVITRQQLIRFGIFVALMLAAVIYVVAVWPAREEAGWSHLPAPVAEGPPQSAFDPVVDPFAEFRVQRDRSRASVREAYVQAMAGGDELGQKAATAAFLQLSHLEKMEQDIENLLRTQGYADATIFLSENETAEVMVQTDNLTLEQVSQIFDVVERVSGVKPSNIYVRGQGK